MGQTQRRGHLHQPRPQVGRPGLLKYLYTCLQVISRTLSYHFLTLLHISDRIFPDLTISVLTFPDLALPVFIFPDLTISVFTCPDLSLPVLILINLTISVLILY